jgi:SAM-dependent methyltransferase
MTISSAANDRPPYGKPVDRDWFREWFDSPYYYKLYYDHDEKEAAAFIDRLLTVLHPSPGSQMLDVACGRGRYACILAAHGFDVTGIDLAPGAIAFARRFEHENLRFLEHDMRRLFCVNCFDYAFNFFTSFGYFRSRQEDLNAIRSIGVALRKGGFLLLDYLNFTYVEKHLVETSQKVIDGTLYAMTRWSDEKHFYKRIVISDDKLPAPLEYTEQVEKLSLADFERLCAPNGLTIRRTFGDYQLAPYDVENSPRLVILAEKQV